MNTFKEVIPRDPRIHYWVQSNNPVLEGKLGTQFTLSNGFLGLRGCHEECPSWGRPEFYMAGTYAGGPAELLGIHDPDHILTHPDRMTPAILDSVKKDPIWTLPNLPFPVGVKLSVDNTPFSFDTHKILSNERLLELDKAIVRRTLVFRDAAGRKTRVDSMRFVSMAQKNLVCLRYCVTPINHSSPIELAGFINADVSNTNGVRLWSKKGDINKDRMTGIECVTAESKKHVAIIQCSVQRIENDKCVLDLFAIADEIPIEQASHESQNAVAQGFDVCMQEHINKITTEMGSVSLSMDENAAFVQGFNFGQLHLHMAVSPVADKIGVPIKGLTGHGYRFLNFWDMDFHMFPYYLLTRPSYAKSLLEYRFSQLDEYRKNAIQWGAKGAQVPWETNTRGCEETAPWLCLQEREIHISADAAYMFKLFVDATGDEHVLHDMGAEFVFETARFYASRIIWNGQNKRYELPDVGCPDQYHTFAHNNVFISRMAAWNISYALELFKSKKFAGCASKISLQQPEIDNWQKVLSNFYIIKPGENGIIEEFDGFFNLDNDLSGICETYCSHSQAVKQPDVLALFTPFRSEYSRDIQRKNWEFYNARTLHGSSLSLPGMGYAAACCGLNDQALYNLFRSCRMDLDDVNLDTDRGVHLAGMAVSWNAIVAGFVGLSVTPQALIINPNLPRQWSQLTFTMYWKYQKVDITVQRDSISFKIGNENQNKVCIKVENQKMVELLPGASYTTLHSK